MRHEGTSQTGALAKANASSSDFFAPKRVRRVKSTPEYGVKRKNHHVSYRPRFAPEAAKLMGDGLKKWQIARHFGVCTNTMRSWAAEHPDFQAAMETADLARLYDRLIRQRKLLAADIRRETAKAMKLDAKVAAIYRRAGLTPPTPLDHSIHETLAALNVEARSLDRRIAAAEKLL